VPAETCLPDAWSYTRTCHRPDGSCRTVPPWCRRFARAIPKIWHVDGTNGYKQYCCNCGRSQERLCEGISVGAPDGIRTRAAGLKARPRPALCSPAKTQVVSERTPSSYVS
jgi:hypothetical protein